MKEEKIHWLLKRKVRLFFWLLIILFISYFILPFALNLFPKWVNQPIFQGGPSLVWVYTFWQIPFTWLLGWFYWYKSKQYDQYVQVILREETL